METFLNLEALIKSHQTIFGIYFFILGLCISSFLNVVIFRYKKINDRESAEAVKGWLEEHNEKLPSSLNDMLKPISLSFPRSFCYSCGNQLKWYHNVPVFSWLFLKGKCGFCSTKISIQYPLVEFFGGLVILFLFYSYINQGLIQFLTISTFFFLCYAMFGIDWKYMDLPDNMTLPAMWLGFIVALNNKSFMNITLEQSIQGAIAGYLTCFVIGLLGKFIFKKEALGGGDYKLLAAVGALTGVTGALFTFFAGSLVGLIIVIIRKSLKIDEIHTPFGPALIITVFIWILFKDNILQYIPLPVI